MLPKTLLAPTLTRNLLVSDNALAQQILQLNMQNGTAVPVLTAAQVLVSACDPDIGDRNEGLSYPRICVYAAEVKNTQAEKFCSFAGSLLMAAEIWTSADLVQAADLPLHYYVEALTNVLSGSVGDWADGVFYSGIYDVKLQLPKVGGLGFVRSARVSWVLNVTQS